MRECEVMEVFSDHIEAFHMKFQYMSRFEERVPFYPILFGGDVSERLKNKISKAFKLLRDKIIYE